MLEVELEQWRRGALGKSGMKVSRANETEVVWTGDKTRPRNRRKIDNGDGTAWEKTKKMKTKAEMDGMCQPRHESYWDNRI